MEYTHKPVEELTFTDDFMFGTIMKNKIICKGVIERLLHIKVGKIEYPSLQKTITPFYESKGIRLDVYVFDSDRVSSISKYKRRSRPLFPSAHVIIKALWMSITSYAVKATLN